MEDLGVLLQKAGFDDAGIRQRLNIIVTSSSVAATIDAVFFIEYFEMGSQQAWEGKVHKHISFIDEDGCPDTSRFTEALTNEMYGIGYELVKKLRMDGASEFAQQAAVDYVLKQILVYRQDGGKIDNAVIDDSHMQIDIVH